MGAPAPAVSDAAPGSWPASAIAVSVGGRALVFGPLRTAGGYPVGVEVFLGRTVDSNTVATKVQEIRRRFRIEQQCLVGDRGMVTTSRPREDPAPASLD